jgi:hypothetical protein
VGRGNREVVVRFIIIVGFVAVAFGGFVRYLGVAQKTKVTRVTNYFGFTESIKYH